MGRPNWRIWTPVRESSTGLRTINPKRIVLWWPERIRPDGSVEEGCPCGCGEFPLGRSATFKMGHDARLRGKLIRAHLTGTDVVYVDRVLDEHGEVRIGEPGQPEAAMHIAEEYGWRKYLEAAELRRDGKNREVLRRALGSKRLVQVGRWEYTGQVAAVYDADGEFEIEYVTKSGEVRKVRVSADEAPPALGEQQ